MQDLEGVACCDKLHAETCEVEISQNKAEQSALGLQPHGPYAVNKDTFTVKF